MTAATHRTRSPRAPITERFSDGFGGHLTGASSGVDFVLTEHTSSSRFASSSTTLPSSSSLRPPMNPFCPPSKISHCRISWGLVRSGSYAIAARENPRNRLVLVVLLVEEPTYPRHSCLGILSSSSSLPCFVVHIRTLTVEDNCMSSITHSLH